MVASTSTPEARQEVITILLVVVVVGVLGWLVTSFVPMEPTIKRIFVAVLVVGLVLWILARTGLLAAAGIHLPPALR
jgi:cation transporter-like permease